MKLKTLFAMVGGIALLQLGCGGGGGSVPICSAFNACGGDPSGKWTIDGMCTETSFAEAIMDTTDLPPECKDVIQSVSMQISGTIEYANGTETSDIDMTMSAKYKYTSACISAQAGGVPVTLTDAVCKSAESSVDPSLGLSLSCGLSGSACACTMTMSQQNQASDTYTISGSTMTYSDGDPMQFCVTGSNLTMRREATDDSPAMQVKAHRS